MRRDPPRFSQCVPVCLLAGFLLICCGVTALWFWGTASIDLRPRNMWAPQAPAFQITLPAGLQIAQVYEGRIPLGPRLDGLDAVRSHNGGAWTQSQLKWAEGGDRFTLLAFVSSDGSSPKENRRRYRAEYQLRSQPRAGLVVVLIWILAGAMVLSMWVENGWSVVSNPGHREQPQLEVAGWSVLLSIGLYTLFVLQAQALFRLSLPWLLTLLLLALPLMLAPAVPRRNGASVLLLVAGLLLWAAVSVALTGTVFASWTALLKTAFACALGATVLVGFRGRFASQTPALGGLMLLSIWSVMVVVLLLREGGMEPRAVLAAAGWISSYHPHLWVAKFSLHWLLVLTWCVLLAISGQHRKRPALMATVVAGAVVTVAIADSKTALGGLLCGLVVAAVALVRPCFARRFLITATVLLFLLAPLLYRLPWQIHQRLPPAAAAVAAEHLESTVRGGVWEYAGRLIGQRPWFGWGFGSAARMPGATTPLGEVLGVPEAERTSGQRNHSGLPGGHPHSLPLLVWLDLGLVGVVLASALIWRVGVAMAVHEHRRRVHASLLGLFATTVVVFGVNYPSWTPTVLSILWMGPAIIGAFLVPSSEWR